ncbi:uncharacterized protein LOC133383184 isoform X6 [Rhineura floridana]|uniref:uncharacterized protein LOC133383184 isoform X6 n=1 Tax=Rhineura floridana TaxID=261503 RepID=UPI002AC88F7E|nr:uncharacterized protein LOC133383184 isoform X6 [Rhineura floridana]
MEGELCLRSLVSVKDSYKVLCLAWIISVRNCFTADFLDRVNTRTNIYMISYKRKMISYVQTSVTLTLKNSGLLRLEDCDWSPKGICGLKSTPAHVYSEKVEEATRGSPILDLNPTNRDELVDEAAAAIASCCWASFIPNVQEDTCQWHHCSSAADEILSLASCWTQS